VQLSFLSLRREPKSTQPSYVRARSRPSQSVTGKMVVNQLMVEVLHVLHRDLSARNLGGTQTTPSPTAAQSQTVSTTVPAPTPTMTSSGGGGPTSSPLLFFVALGFGVVFTNLWSVVIVHHTLPPPRLSVC
jgi:hypothetical protein